MLKIKLLSIVLILFINCQSNTKETILWVNSNKVSCGTENDKCLQIQKGENFQNGEWENFKSKITGFDYQEGFIYKLRVKETPVENSSSEASKKKYTLVETILKKEDQKLKLNGNWEAFKINGSIIKQRRIVGAGGIPQLHIDIEQMKIRGNDNCNNFRGTIKKLNETEIEWGPMATTLKMCADMSIPKRFNPAMEAVKKYKFKGDNLILTDENGNELFEFIRLADTKMRLNDLWALEAIEGKSILDTKAPTIEIQSKKMRLMGNDGCNNFSGEITTLTNTEFTVGRLRSTKKMCEDMTLSNRFNHLLNSVRSYRLSELKLSLIDELGNVVLVFKKID
ncbi:META domain-containing protein [Polaribacter sp. MED152]|uniref:META domain-containing protein n=1 Tax=Polaribacter sp. MED152 TaxID=313598 RepID=UPI000068CBED|nr:META domain-containing protein [Polaribacter sp. MED152]EAQ42448.1 hypothetical protein MED152_07000 [Polaribacter sp. MED152]